MLSVYVQYSLLKPVPSYRPEFNRAKDVDRLVVFNPNRIAIYSTVVNPQRVLRSYRVGSSFFEASKTIFHAFSGCSRHAVREQQCRIGRTVLQITPHMKHSANVAVLFRFQMQVAGSLLHLEVK